MSTVLHGDIAYTTSGALISFKNGSKPNATPTSVIIETENKVQDKVAAWGPNNDYPQKLLKNLQLNGAGLSGLKVLARTHYGSGFVLAKETFEDGKRIIHHNQ